MQGLADLISRGLQKSIRNAPADNDLIDLAEQIFQQGELGGHLGPAHDGDQRPGRRPEGPAERLQFLDQQRPGRGHGRILGHAVGGGLGAVGGREGVIHIDITEPGQPARERRVIFGLAGLKAHVLAQDQPPPAHVDAVVPVLNQGRLHAQQAAQAFCHGLQRERRVTGPGPRAAEVRQQDDPGPVLKQMPQRGQAGPDPRLAGDHAILERHVVILPDQHDLVPEVQIGHFYQRVHGA